MLKTKYKKWQKTMLKSKCQIVETTCKNSGSTIENMVSCPYGACMWHRGALRWVVGCCLHIK